MAKESLHKWFSRNKGKGWIDCKTGKPCGRKSAKGGSKRPYPACRPTKAQCTSAARKKTSSKRISWKKEYGGEPVYNNMGMKVPGMYK